MRRFIKFFLIFYIVLIGSSSFTYAQNELIDFTKEELEFINEHPVIKVGVDPTFVPFEFFDKDGEYNGIAADYIKIIERDTGIKFEIQKNLTWTEAYDLALNHEIDILSAIGKTEEREELFIFSDSYLNFKRVIVTRDNDRSIGSVEDLKGETVAVQRNSSHHSYLLQFDGINLSLYDSVETAVTNVANGSETAFLGNLATTDYQIRSSGLTNLRYVSFEAQKQEGIHFAIRKDWPELQSIIDKAINNIGEETRVEIQNKWINVTSEVDYSLFIRIIIIAVCIVTGVLTISLYWIFRLQKEISKRKIIEYELMAAKQKAEELSKTKSKFLSHMSHEIRTPLNAIIGMASIARNTDSLEYIKVCLVKMEDNSRHLLGIVNDILDFSKMESDNLKLESNFFSLTECIDFVTAMFKERTEEKGLHFNVNLLNIEHEGITSDSLRLNQVLINLLSNAVKFTDNGGEIELNVEEVAHMNGESVFKFTVKDNGIGIDSQQAKLLFTPFVQANSSITRQYGGTGLGLVISKNIVTAMGGEIELSTETGKGSSFSFTIRVPAQTIDKGESIPQKEDGKKIDFSDNHILVVDDIEINREIVEALLKETNADISEAENGREALDMFMESEEGYYDLILMDMQMPVMDGCTVTKEIRKSGRRDADSIIIIAMTANVMQEDIDIAYESGMNGFLGKPIEVELLYKSMEEWL